MNFKTTLCAILVPLVLGSCSYQKSELEPLERGFSTFGSFKGNLNSYYTQFVKTPNGEQILGDLPWDEFTSYDTRVDYRAAFLQKNTPAYQQLRESILGHIESTNTSILSKNEQIAFYINAYNFLAIDIVLENSGANLIESIADLGGTDSFNAFSDSNRFGYKVAGSSNNLSLDEIEKGILANLTQNSDARLHFAVICASEGCPVLLHRPYSGEGLEEQLDFATRSGLAKKRMFETDEVENLTYLSSIFDWYWDDFINDIARNNNFDDDEQYIEAFVKKYTSKDQLFFPYDVEYIEYDWTLNKVKDL